jgi:hypothetical protein
MEKKKSAICDNVDEFIAHYVKLNKPGTEWQIW